MSTQTTVFSSQWLKMLSIITLLSVPLWSLAQPIKDWDRGYGGSGYENCNAVLQTTDLGYVLGGNTSTGVASGDISEDTRDDTSIPFWIPNSVGDFWVIRTDTDGELLWDARYGGNRSDICWGLVETDDGGFLFGGESFSDDLLGERTDTSVAEILTTGLSKRMPTEILNGIALTEAILLML